MTKVSHAASVNPSFTCTNGAKYFLFWTLDTSNDPAISGGTLNSYLEVRGYNGNNWRSTGWIGIATATSTKITITQDTNGDLYWKKIS